MPSPAQTRKNLLFVARNHLAERGYHGTSLAAVSGELGLTKQALLHHFKSKDLLYAAVLEQLGAELLELLFASLEASELAEDQLAGFFAALTRQGLAQPADLSLVLRDLMDFQGRGPDSGQDSWPLQNVFEPLIALIQATPRWQGAGFAEALSVASQMLAAICLFPSAQGALASRFGQAAVDQVRTTFLVQTQDLVRERLTRD
ncbi:TetR/AcrR family transcriptional regulator [Pseudophaeobacter leonis]|uniref:TetR/AcrR family transcriptional regulator n=1 Tax=Pseudophaeobacter leonis TaxID=1144477 RepID=UPI0009F1FFCA|nr:TetR/AcrR family transcriptional regulator [Pseudophaeobacter leonis]